MICVYVWQVTDAPEDIARCGRTSPRSWATTDANGTAPHHRRTREGTAAPSHPRI